MDVVAGTTGMDSSLVRPVSVTSIQLSNVVGNDGRFIDVWLDRPMTPYPAAYTLTTNGLWSADKLNSITGSTAAQRVVAVFKQLVVPSLDGGTASTDLEPSSLFNPDDPLNLGHVGMDNTGDYLVNDGDSPYKTRILRRMISVPGGFLHLGNGYGVGVGQAGKKLSQSSVLAQMSTSAEKQINKEPETARATCRAVLDPSGKGLVRFVILARTKSGQATKFVVPIQVK